MNKSNCLMFSLQHIRQCSQPNLEPNRESSNYFRNFTYCQKLGKLSPFCKAIFKQRNSRHVTFAVYFRTSTVLSGSFFYFQLTAITSSVNLELFLSEHE